MYMEYRMKTTLKITVFSLLLAGCVASMRTDTTHPTPTEKIVGTSSLVYHKGLSNPNLYRIGGNPQNGEACQGNNYRIINPVDIMIPDANGVMTQILVVPNQGLTLN